MHLFAGLQCQHQCQCQFEWSSDYDCEFLCHRCFLTAVILLRMFAGRSDYDRDAYNDLYNEVFRPGDRLAASFARSGRYDGNLKWDTESSECDLVSKIIQTWTM